MADSPLPTGYDRQIAYDYDGLYRLTNATYTQDGAETLRYDYTYDLVGNRTGETITLDADPLTALTRTFNYNTANQLDLLTTSDTSEQWRFGYDTDGNMTEMGRYADGAYRWHRRAHRLKYFQPQQFVETISTRALSRRDVSRLRCE